MTFSSEIGDGLLCGSGSNPQDTFATLWAERPAAQHNSFAGNGNTMDLSQLVVSQEEPVSQEDVQDNLMEQMLDMQFEVCLLARSLAARSHIYKAEDLMISEMQLGLMTSTKAKLNLLKNRKLKLERLDRELDQTRPARDPPQPAPQPAPEGLEQRQPSGPARDPPAREEISIEGVQGGTPLQGLKVRRRRRKAYSGEDLRSFVADCINKYSMGPGAAGADAETVFHHVFQLVKAKWTGSFPNKSAYNRNFSKSLQEKVWRYKKENPAQPITGEWLDILAAEENSAGADPASNQ